MYRKHLVCRETPAVMERNLTAEGGRDLQSIAFHFWYNGLCPHQSSSYSNGDKIYNALKCLIIIFPDSNVLYLKECH